MKRNHPSVAPPRRRLTPRGHRGRPRFAFETLERRLALALHIENFSDDFYSIPIGTPFDRTKAGYDSWDTDPSTVPGGDTDADPNTTLGPDELLIPHTVGSRVRIETNRFDNATHFLFIGAPDSYLIDFAAGRTQPGGLDPGAEVAAVGFRYRGAGRVTVQGDNSIKTLILQPSDLWSNLTVVSNDPSDTGVEVGAIQTVTFTGSLASDLLLLDDITVLVFDAGFSNNAPGVGPDHIFTLPNQPVTFNPLANDGDVDGDPISLVPSFQPTPSNGTVVVTPGGAFIYTPNAGFHGIDTFEYMITDGRVAAGSETRGTIRVTVNTPPPIVAKSYPLPHGYIGSISVSASEGLLVGVNDADGDPLTVRLSHMPTYGNVTIQADGSFTYTPATPDGRVFTDSFRFVLNDGFQDSDPIGVFIDVPNTAPVLADDHAGFSHGQPSPIFHALRYEDADGDQMVSAIVVGQPAYGEVSLFINDGLVVMSYVPHTGDLRGGDVFTYRINDGYADSNVAAFEIRAPNAIPVARDASTGIPFPNSGELRHSILGPSGSTEIRGNLLTDDRSFPTYSTGLGSDGDGDSLTALLDGNPATMEESRPKHGTVSLSPDGEFVYTPNPGYHLWGTDRFGYRFWDGHDVSNLAYVTILQSLGPMMHASDSFTVRRGGELSITTTQLVGNDRFASGLPAAWFAQYVQFRRFNLSSGDEVIWTGERVIDHFGDDFGTKIRYGDPAFILRVGEHYPPGTQTVTYAVEYPGPGLDPNGVLISNTFPVEGGLGEVLIDETESMESDSDGVPDVTESFVPHPDLIPFMGDGNGDGVLDSQQANVASVPTFWTSSNLNEADFVTFVAAPGTQLFDVESTSNPSALDSPNADLFPLGFFSFHVTDLLPREATTVTMYPPPGIVLNSYLKYGLEPEDNPVTNLNERLTEHWYTFLYDGTTGAEFINDDDGDPDTDRILLHFVDEQRGDTVPFQSNGVIDGSGGPAFVPGVHAAVVASAAGDVVQIESPAGTRLIDVVIGDIPTGSGPSGFHAESGLLGFTVLDVPVGGSIDVEITFEDNFAANSYLKRGPSQSTDPNDWFYYEFLSDGSPGSLGATLYDDDNDGNLNRVVLRLQDGGLGDHDFTANGVIVDPGGPALRLPPVATDDDVAIDEDHPLHVAAAGLLTNDISPTGDPLTSVLATGPAHGTLTLQRDGSFTYVPDANFHGIDTFTYLTNDGRLDSEVATVTITVNPVNDAPSVTISGPPIGVRGQPLTFNLSATDAEPDDLVAGFTYRIDWNGDGTVDETAVGPASGIAIDHLFAVTGNFSVTATATDRNQAASASATQPLEIRAVALIGSDLFVGGTAANDHIDFFPDRHGQVMVRLNRDTFGPFQPTRRLVAFGQEGNDNVSKLLLSHLTAQFYGDDGNDHLFGGLAGDSLLVGGTGDDHLHGSLLGRNILVGGLGRDHLHGQHVGSNLLIGGTTAYDSNDAALLAILAEWTSDHDFDARVANLRNGGGLNGAFVLVSNETVFDDGAMDQLFGGLADDWLFEFPGDKNHGAP